MQGNLVYHSINGIPFTPVNREEFSLSFIRNPEERWKQDFSTSNKVVLPEEAYTELLRHLTIVGVQQSMEYNLSINNTNYPFMVDLSDGFTVGNSNAEISIKRFKSKDNVVSNLENMTWEYLHSVGKITDADMVNIPYCVVKDNQEELMMQCAIMIYVLSDQLAESIATASRMIAEFVAMVTPSVVVSTPPGTTVNTGLYIKYGLLIALELAKTLLLTLALRELVQQLFELIIPPIKNFKAMTVDRLLTIGLASQGLSYQSTIKNHFKHCTIIPIPIIDKGKKWFEVLAVNDSQRINLGYPTSSDTVPTVMNLIDEVCKMFNIEPKLVGSTLHLSPKGQGISLPQVELQHNMNDQDLIEQRYTADLSGMWNTKIISYANDFSDKHLFDNPKGLRVQYKSIPNNIAPTNELTTIRGLVDIRINFSLCTIKKKNVVERRLEKVAQHLDSFLNTNMMAKIKNRDGVLVVSQADFGLTKIIYQFGGKQIANYTNIIGAKALYEQYHAIDDPARNLYESYTSMPIGMNNEQFMKVLDNNFVNLEGLEVEVMSCDYFPELSTANITYRKRNRDWGKNIITTLVDAD